MQKIFKIVAVFCVIALFAGCSGANTVVSVGDSDYNKEWFNFYLYNSQGSVLMNSGFQSIEEIPEDFFTQKEDGKSLFDTIKEQTIDSIVSDSVAYHKALEMGLELTDDDKTQIDEQIKTMKDDENAKTLLKGMGVSWNTLKHFYEEGIVTQKLMPELIKKGDIKVDSDEVKKTFEDAYVKAKHILIATVDTATQTPLSEDEVNAAKVKAEDILNQLKAGADFDTLMNEHNEDPGMSSSPDGYVFTTGEMVKEFEEAAFALKENEISGLVTTSYGIHIIKRVPFDYNSSTESHHLEDIENELAMPQFEELLDKWKKDFKVKKNEKAINKVKPFELELFYGA